MPWFRVDDKHHDHPKTRRALRSAPGKRRDAAAMGLWELAGSWSADNLMDGFVPEDELFRWDDDWQVLAERLVDARYWTRAERDGEPGYQFINWEKQQPLKADVEAKREAAKERMRKHRAASSAERSNDVRANAPRSDADRSRTPSRPVPSRPAAAAAGDAQPLPPAVEILKGKLDAARLAVRWDLLGAERLAVIEELIEVHGDEALVKSAIEQHRADSPAQFAQAWIPKWQALVPPGTPLRVVRNVPKFCPTHDWVQLDDAGICRSCAGEALAPGR